MFLSVVIPTYNESRFLGDLLAHIDRPDGVEVLVVDDVRSKDGSQKVAEAHGAQYLTCDGDVSKARNLGAEHAKGEYLLFLDSDQFLWSAHPMQDLVSWLRLHPVRCATGGINQTMTTKTIHAEAREIYRRFFPTLSGGYVLVRRDIFLHIGGFPPRATSLLTWEDLDLDVKLKFLGVPVVWLPFNTTHRREFTWRLPDGTRIL
jgi:glycosyltransferase involved in cell wall biosynthesis